MSSFSSVWSRTMSTMTIATSDASTSAPHTPSSPSVITGLKAALGAGSFFHARLQEGQRFEEQSSPTKVRYELSAYTISPKAIRNSGTHPPKPNTTNACEEQPRASQRHSVEKTSSGAGAASSSSSSAPIIPLPQALLSLTSTKKATRSPSATPMSSDNQDFWEMINHAQQAANGATPTSRPYHYITRSQSVDAAADAGRLQQAPKMHKKNASYSPGIGTPAFQEAVQNIPAASSTPPTWCPSRGRYLSPIEEVQFFPEKQGDSVSLHSTTSTQSNLFIHRSVRRTPSTSTFNSGHSLAPRSPEDPTNPHGSSPSRAYAQSRPFPGLPVIPASPRESQNVFEPEPVSSEDATITFPMPVVYPKDAYAVFEPPEEPEEPEELEEQDLADSLPTPRFAVPRYPLDFDAMMKEREMAEAREPRVSVTPSLLSRSESVRTELTYLTAQDSAAGSRRASAMPPDDLEAGNRHRSPLADGDTTLVDTPSKGTSPAARLKASLDTLLSKSPKMRKSPGAGADHSATATDVRSTFSMSPKAALWLGQVQEGVKKHVPWGEGKGKPAEILFWTGFLAPWCWLIGGWMLARSGETMVEGLPSGAKEPELPVHSASSLRLHRSRGPPSAAPSVLTEKNTSQPVSVWQAAKNSSVELIEGLRGHRAREPSVRVVRLQGDVPVPIMINKRLDPWVTRCRVAAIVSGMLILVLCIVALVVLVRSL